MADIKRPNYFTSQFLVEKDFDDEQAYHLTSRRRHNRVAHTSGVADGLGVTQVNGNQVQVGSGTAVDSNGREIVLNDPVTHQLGVSGAGLDVWLTIAYHEDLDTVDRDTQGLNEFTRTTERPLVQDGSAVPPSDGSVIVLARIHLNAAGLIESSASIDASVRTLSSAKLGPGVVTVAHLDANSVNSSKLGALSVTAPKLADGAVQSAKLANYAVGSAKLDGFARGQHGVFLETFEELPSDWSVVQGDGVESIVPDGETGGKALRIVGHRWRAFPQIIPFDPSKLYRIRARFRPIAHASDPTRETVYVGVQGVAADGVTLVSTHGDNTTGNQHYVCVAGFSLSTQPLGAWIERTGWFRGHAAAGAGGAFLPTAPGALHTNVRYFQPLFIIGYNGGDGTAEIDSIAIDVFDEDGVVRTYSGLDVGGTVAANKVVATSIAAAAVGTSKLADGAVTTLKLADLNVTGAKLAASAVDASKISNDAIETAKLAAGAVTLPKLAPGSVDGSKIVGSSIGSTHFAPESVLGQHIGAGAIGPDKLQFGAVGIAALAVQPGFNGLSSLGAGQSTSFLISQRSSALHEFVICSVTCITSGGTVTWEESSVAGSFINRFLIVKNTSVVTITFLIKTFTLLL
jgi:hypothetical protein